MFDEGRGWWGVLQILLSVILWKLLTILVQWSSSKIIYYISSNTHTLFNLLKMTTLHRILAKINEKISCQHCLASRCVTGAWPGCHHSCDSEPYILHHASLQMFVTSTDVLLALFNPANDNSYAGLQVIFSHSLMKIISYHAQLHISVRHAHLHVPPDRSSNVSVNDRSLWASGRVTTVSSGAGCGLLLFVVTITTTTWRSVLGILK